jgi:DNA-binding XRE family transcriptional regulator
MIGGNRPRKLLVISNPQAAFHERREFAAKVRAARAVLGWSQAELGMRVGVTQRSINRLEKADVDVRRSTAVAIETALRDEGIVFEMLAEGGFRMLVHNTYRGAHRR